MLQINEDFPSAGDAGELRPPRLLLNLTIRDYPTYVIIQNYRFQVTFQLSSPPSQPTPFAKQNIYNNKLAFVNTIWRAYISRDKKHLFAKFCAKLIIIKKYQISEI